MRLSSPLMGKYLIQNRRNRLAIRCIDFACSLWTIGMKKGTRISVPQTILLSNLGHLGDVVLMSSLLPVLKRTFPKIRIGVLIGSWAQEIVREHPLIDFIHIYDHWHAARTGEPLWRKMKKARGLFQSALKEIREIRYEVFLECRAHFPNSIFLAYRAKIPARLGLISSGFGSLLTHSLPWTEPKESVMESIFALLIRFLGVVPSTLTPYLPIRSSPHPSLPNSYLVIHMGSARPIQEWPLEKWRELCQRLIQEGHFLVFTGKGAREAKEIQWVAKDLPSTIDLSDQLTCSAWMSVIKNGQLVISVDTGSGHMAAAMGTPAVLIYHGIRPFNLWRPLSDKAEIVTHPVACHPCHLSRGCATMACIREVSVDLVYAKVQKALSNLYQK